VTGDLTAGRRADQAARVVTTKSLALLPLLLLLACSSSSEDAPSTADSGDDTAATIDSGTTDAPASDVAPSDSPSTEAGDSGGETGDSTPATSKTRLRVHYPASGKKLTVRGATTPWTWTAGVAMTDSGDDTFVYETDAITAPTEWKPLLDDTTWSRGPNYVVKPGETLDVYPHFTITAGTVTKKWPAFHSTTLGNDRDVWVYLPPTYLENARVKLPVVYMHDGQNLFDPTLAFGGNEWKVDETMNDAAESGSIREAIVIGVGNTSARMDEYTPTFDASEGFGGKGDKYLTMLVTELKPVVDGALRTETARESTAIMGSSLGGLISSYAGTTRMDTFGLIGALSPSTWWDSTVIIKDVAATKGKSPLPLKVYVDSGDSGTSSDDMTNTKQLAQTYRDVGYVDGTTLDYLVQKGATHSEVYWAQRLPGALQFLLGKRPATP
jgi:predicted alpha/beta superfamily hydrolase